MLPVGLVAGDLGLLLEGRWLLKSSVGDGTTSVVAAQGGAGQLPAEGRGINKSLVARDVTIFARDRFWVLRKYSKYCGSLILGSL